MAESMQTDCVSDGTSSGADKQRTITPAETIEYLGDLSTEMAEIAIKAGHYLMAIELLSAAVEADRWMAAREADSSEPVGRKQPE